MEDIQEALFVLNQGKSEISISINPFQANLEPYFPYSIFFSALFPLSLFLSYFRAHSFLFLTDIFLVGLASIFLISKRFALSSCDPSTWSLYFTFIKLFVDPFSRMLHLHGFLFSALASCNVFTERPLASLPSPAVYPPISLFFLKLLTVTLTHFHLFLQAGPSSTILSSTV